MNLNIVLIVLSVTVKLMPLNAQFGSYEVHSFYSGSNANRFTETYEQPRRAHYQNYQLTNVLPERMTTTSRSCERFLSYRTDLMGQTFAIISIFNPNYKKNIIRAIFSVAAKLSTVSAEQVEKFDIDTESIVKMHDLFVIILKSAYKLVISTLSKIPWTRQNKQ